VSGQKVPVARLAKPPKAEFTWVNEYFGGKRNAANGTLWTDTKYKKMQSNTDNLEIRKRNARRVNSADY